MGNGDLIPDVLGLHSSRPLRMRVSGGEGTVGGWEPRFLPTLRWAVRHPESEQIHPLYNGNKMLPFLKKTPHKTPQFARLRKVLP